jgi:hypothetical protein
VDGHQPSKQFRIIDFSFLHHFESTSALGFAGNTQKRIAPENSLDRPELLHLAGDFRSFMGAGLDAG